MLFFTYILQNHEGRLYVGHTDNLEARLKRHNDGTVFWTGNRGPWRLIHSEACGSSGDAMKKERWLKSLKSPRSVSEYVEKCVGATAVERADSGRALHVIL